MHNLDGRGHLSEKSIGRYAAIIVVVVVVDSHNTRNTSTMNEGSSVTVRVEFSGGLELLLEDKTKARFQLQFPSPITVAALLLHLRDHRVKDRPELFMIENSV
jgi:hypothetical protein